VLLHVSDTLPPELRLVRAAIRLRQPWMIGDERPLDAGHFLGQGLEGAAFIRCRVVEL